MSDEIGRPGAPGRSPAEVDRLLGAQRVEISRLTGQLDDVRRSSRRQHVLGPVLLLVIGLMMPAIELTRDGPPQENRTLFGALPLFVGVDPNRLGQVAQYPNRIPLGGHLMSFGLVVAAVAVVLLLLSAPTLLLDPPLRWSALAVRISAVALFVAVVSMLGAVVVLPETAVVSILHPGTALLVAAAIWLLAGGSAAD